MEASTFDAYIADSAGPAPLIMDLRIAHERFGSSSNPRADDSNHHSISSMPAVASTSGRLHYELVCAFCFCGRPIGKRPHFVQLLDSIAARNVQLCT